MSLLTYTEVAERLHVHPKTVRRLVQNGDLTPVRLGRAVRFQPSDVQALVARRRGEAVKRPSEGQLRAYHAKVGALARATGVQKSRMKEAALAQAHAAFGVDVESATELEPDQLSLVLDWLEERLEQLEGT